MTERDDVHMAVDIGRVSAVAWHGAAGVDSQACTLGRPGDVAAHLLALDAWLAPLVAAVRPHRMYIERHTGRGAGSRTLDAYTGAIRSLAARHGIPCDASVTAISARKLALGRGIADKSAAIVLAQRVLGDMDVEADDVVDARILLAAIPGHLAKLRTKAEAARLKRNAAAKARRKAARAAIPFPQAAE